MKGTETKLLRFMESSDRRFVIPVYQRNYNWKIENCKQLFDDLVKTIKFNRKTHFFGSIVSITNFESDKDEYQIIDGQQRLTTISLLLLAIHNLIETKQIYSETSNLSSMILNKYLIDQWAAPKSRIKLRLIDSDQKIYEKLFEDEEDYDRLSNIVTNYDYFCKRILKEEISVDDLFNAVSKLEIISIKLGADDNPQLIFESLNSTGLDLSEGDKIRNFVLMDLSLEKQNEYFEKYWKKIEDNTDNHIDLFIRDYLSKIQSTPSFNKIYSVFKNYVNDNSIKIQDLLEDLLFYSKLYNILLNGKIENRSLATCIFRLNFLETSVTRPFLMEVLKLYKEENLSIDEVIQIFKTVESYIVRRLLCDLPTNQLNKTFLSLNREIIRFDGTVDNYLEKFNYVLSNKKDRGRFPDDQELEKAVREKEVYKMNSKNRIYILERFENFNTIEDKNVYEHIESGDYSIEHIMPQHLSDAWKENLGEDYSSIHDQWLHRLANLTLTAYNSKYSNASFQQKRDMDHGFLSSGLRLNQWIANKKSWGITELIERSNYLEQLAVKIWKSPVSNYQPPIKEVETLTLADDFKNMIGKKIGKYSLQSVEVPVNSWIEMYISVLQTLYSEDPSILNQIVNRSLIANQISKDKSSLRVPEEIVPGIYIEKNLDTWNKLTALRKVFNAYKLEPDDLVFYISELKKTEINSEKDKMNFDFWKFAVPIILSYNSDNSVFKNLKPFIGTEYWGNTGINKFLLKIIVRSSSARVELYLNKTSEDNKRVFDNLYLHKDTIEKQLNQKLVWDRGDDKKSSKIYHALENVDYQNENEWRRIAEFLGRWSSLFYQNIIDPDF